MYHLDSTMIKYTISFVAQQNLYLVFFIHSTKHQYDQATINFNLLENYWHIKWNGLLFFNMLDILIPCCRRLCTSMYFIAYQFCRSLKPWIHSMSEFRFNHLNHISQVFPCVLNISNRNTYTHIHTHSWSNNLNNSTKRIRTWGRILVWWVTNTTYIDWPHVRHKSAGELTFDMKTM